MNRKMGKLDEKIIVKFLAGECSEEELRSLNVWLEESEENAHELFTLEELYHLGKSDVVSEEALLAKAEKQLSQRLGEERTDALVSDAAALCNELCGQYKGLSKKEKIRKASPCQTR